MTCESSIFKLSIQGIRSFDNSDRQTIQFGTPLTLIVGQNGTGKTTIIECLRYATTGDLPPNSKGGAFIHDPKITGEREVLAQVKLAFYNTNNVQMICTRSMQLVVKKTARTFKTLEGQLLVLSNGRRSTISTKCADLDSQMPLYLGTPKAVLDYVVFCHQEDSLWPLAEPSVVKKRFDEIFEATRFTKALESIKTLRKEYTTDIKLKQQEVQYLGVDRDRAVKAEARREKLQDDITALTEESEVLKSEMDEVSAEVSRVFETNQKFQESIYKLDNCRSQKVQLQGTLERLSSSLDVMTESDEELAAVLASFQERMETRRLTKEFLQTELDEQRAQLELLRRKYNESILRHGKLKSESDSHHKNLAAQHDFISLKADELHLSEVAHSDEVEFEKELLVIRKTVTNDLESVRMSGSRKVNDVSSTLQDLTTRKLVEEQKKLSKREQARALELELQSIQDSLDEVEADEGEIAYQRSLLADLEAKQVAAKKKIEDFESSNDLASLTKKIESIEADIEKNNQELLSSNQQVDERAKLGLLRDEVAKRTEAFQSLIKSNSDDFRRVVGELNEVSAESDLRKAIEKIQSELDEVTRAYDEKRRDVSQTEGRFKTTEIDIAKRRAEISQLQTEIADVLGDDVEIAQYDTIVGELEKDFATASYNREYREFAVKYYQTAVAEVKSVRHRCLLCERQFAENGEKDDFETLMERKTLLLPDVVESDKVFDEVKEDLDSTRKLAPAVSNLLHLSNIEIPHLEEELKILKEKVLTVGSEAEKLSEEMGSLKSRISEASSYRKFAGDVARYHREIVNLESDISALLDSLPLSSSGQSAADVHASITALNSELRSLKADSHRLTELRLQEVGDVSRIDTLVNNKRLEVNRIERLLESQHAKLEQISKLRDQVAASKAEVKESTDELDRLVPLLKEQEQLLSQAKLEAAAEERTLLDRNSKIYEVNSEFSSRRKVIQEYMDNGGDGQLDVSQRAVDTASEEVEAGEASIRSLGEKISQEESALTDMRGYERTVRDNLEVRRVQSELVNLDEEIEAIESLHAEKEKAKYEQETSRLRNEYSRLNSAYSGKLGEMKQMEGELVRIKEELETEFRDIHDNYQKAVIKLNTTSFANEDLAKYSKALDSAIMKYHSLKMEEINRVVDELWKKTYMGTDVDTILIRSDNETGKGNRTYNYRVCMVKQDVELDMRGRCSAGQKVLASIIIRLALSECFGTSCGLIALDEPTTNLDSDNAESLAKSLSSIIEMRRAQKNFQLIVITHDEHFLAHMNASAHADHFFRVTRDARQNSQIECVPIGRIIE